MGASFLGPGYSPLSCWGLGSQGTMHRGLSGQSQPGTFVMPILRPSIKWKIRQDGARKCTSCFPRLLWLVSGLGVLATLVIVPVQVQGLQQSIVCENQAPFIPGAEWNLRGHLIQPPSPFLFISEFLLNSFLKRDSNRQKTIPSIKKQKNDFFIKLKIVL